jgi:hypothetical protein
LLALFEIVQLACRHPQRVRVRDKKAPGRGNARTKAARPAEGARSVLPLPLAAGASWRMSSPRTTHDAPSPRLAKPTPRGGRKNKTRKRRTSAPARKKKYVRAFFFFKTLFSAFFGVSRQGEFENTRKKNEYVSKTNHRGNIFSAGEIFSG